MNRDHAGRGKRANTFYASEVHRLKKPRKGAVIKIETWRDPDGTLLRYNMSYINPMIMPKDNGRVLGYDNAHGHSHRHYMGTVQPVEFTSFEDLTEHFLSELYEIWEREND